MACGSNVWDSERNCFPYSNWKLWWNYNTDWCVLLQLRTKGVHQSTLHLFHFQQTFRQSRIAIIVPNRGQGCLLLLMSSGILKYPANCHLACDVLGSLPNMSYWALVSHFDFMVNKCFSGSLPQMNVGEHQRLFNTTREYIISPFGFRTLIHKVNMMFE